MTHSPASRRPVRPAHSTLQSAALLLALFLLPACTTDDAATAMDGRNLDALPTLGFEEVVRIGSVDDPDVGFSRIGQVVGDRDGNVYLFEAQEVEIRAYSPAGELLRRMGRRGEGPGEFSGRIGGFGISGDTLWVFDSGHLRLSLFSRSGELLSDVPLEEVRAPLHQPGASAQIWPRHMDDDGLFVGEEGMNFSGNGAPERDTVDIPLVRFGADGRVVDTIGFYPDVRGHDAEMISVGRSRHPLPFPPSSAPRQIRTARERIMVEQQVEDVEAGLRRLRIVRLAHAGDTVRTREFGYRPSPFPEKVLDSIATARAQVVGSMLLFGLGGVEQIERHPEDSAAARVAIRRQMPFPEMQPPVQGHRITSEGAIWLQREDLGTATRKWTVFDAEDEPVGVLDLPAGLRIAWASDDSFWTVEPDEWDVPWLVRYRILPVGEGAG